MSVDRINIINAPDGEISTIDKYQFAVGIYPGSDTPVTKLSKKRNKFKNTIDFYKHLLTDEEIKKVSLYNIFNFKKK